jgi:hypothetical protein
MKMEVKNGLLLMVPKLVLLEKEAVRKTFGLLRAAANN